MTPNLARTGCRLAVGWLSVDIVAMLAVIPYLVFGGMVDKARGLCGVNVPAAAGGERFGRIHRVQVNTLELLVALLPALVAAVWGSVA